MTTARRLSSPAALFEARRSGPVASATLWLAGAAVAIGGYEHAHLYHVGYSSPKAVGILFLLNAAGSIGAIGLLAARRVALFVVTAVGICVGSIGGILLSHSSSGLFGLREGGWSTDARVCLVAEITVIAALAVGALLDRERLVGTAS